MSMKIILLINVKMPTTVGILRLMSMIIPTSGSYKAMKIFVQHDQLKFHARLSELGMKKVL